MDIAIMGAGLSGLACAITLEKHGITPPSLKNGEKWETDLLMEKCSFRSFQDLYTIVSLPCQRTMEFI